MAFPLLELQDDLLVAVAERLPFRERLRLAEVCRRLRQLCAGPSPLWRCVDISRRLRRKPGLEDRRALQEEAVQILFDCRRCARCIRCIALRARPPCPPPTHPPPLHPADG